jgi:hypothetical protein
MRFDGWNTIEGRHLVFVYASVILIQGGYFLYVASQWLKLRGPEKPAADLNAKKTTRPV